MVDDRQLKILEREVRARSPRLLPACCFRLLTWKEILVVDDRQLKILGREARARSR